MTGAAAGLVSGRYRLGPLLGSGGSASVFAAVDTRTGDALALKILHPELSRSPRLREAFFREAREAGRVRHPNVVAVLDVGVHDDETDPLAWIALELAPGQTLAEYVERTGPLPVPDALTLALAVLRGLAAVHGAGLIHRDVSPANIMIAPEADGFLPIGAVRLLDFGLADATDRAATGSDLLRSEPEPAEDRPDRQLGVLGSVNYMSPEQAAGGSVDERGDLYQLGGVLYFALTGSPPFPRDTVDAVRRAHALTPPPVPSVVRPGIRRGVDRIVVRALLKDRSDRFASADEMRRAILALEPSATAEAAATGQSGDDHTRRFGRPLDSSPAPETERTAVLPRRPTPRPAPTRSAPAALLPPPAVRRTGAGRAAGWLALVLVAGVIAAGWVAAAADGARTSVAVSSTPSAVETTSATPTATPPPQTPAPAEAERTSVRVPELTTMPLGEARAALEAAGLRVGLLSTQDSVRTGDTVLTLNPAPGTWLAEGDPVDLLVASGSNSVPATVGLAQADAVAALQNAGFTAVVVVRAEAAAPTGTVLASQPMDATVLRLGTTVTLTVVAAVVAPTSSPPPQTPAPTATPAGTATPAP